MACARGIPPLRGVAEATTASRSFGWASLVIAARLFGPSKRRGGGGDCSTVDFAVWGDSGWPARNGVRRALRRDTTSVSICTAQSKKIVTATDASGDVEAPQSLEPGISDSSPSPVRQLRRHRVYSEGCRGMLTLQWCMSTSKRCRRRRMIQHARAFLSFVGSCQAIAGRSRPLRRRSHIQLTRRPSNTVDPRREEGRGSDAKREDATASRVHHQ